MALFAGHFCSTEPMLVTLIISMRMGRMKMVGGCGNFVASLVLDEAGWAKMFICSVNAMVSALFSV